MAAKKSSAKPREAESAAAAPKAEKQGRSRQPRTDAKEKTEPQQQDAETAAGQGRRGRSRQPTSSKSSTGNAKVGSKPQQQEPEEPEKSEGQEKRTGQRPPASHKRKAPQDNDQDNENDNEATETSAPPPKASRRSRHKTTTPTQKSQKQQRQQQPRPSTLLTYLLSNSAATQPADETAFQQTAPKDKSLKTYTAANPPFNPFEELLSAVILSRPISHKLGLRTIRTLLNDPYNFHSAKAVQQAGREKVLQGVWDAKTQHKEKTATEVSELAGVVLDEASNGNDKDGSELAAFLTTSEGSVEEKLEALQGKVKGVGKTGMQIFRRRVQWLWSEAFPFVDERTGEALRKLGLPGDAEELRGLVEENWSGLQKVGELASEDEDEERKKRRAFVVLLERAVGADLEGKVDEVLKAVAAEEEA